MNILICTPGRLLYHLKNTQNLKFDYLQYFIFDEADRMFDLGFEREMTECLNFIKSKNRSLYIHQANFQTKDHVKTVLVSATLSQKIENLASQLMTNEKRVGFDVDEHHLDLSKIIPQSISQHYVRTPL